MTRNEKERVRLAKVAAEYRQLADNPDTIHLPDPISDHVFIEKMANHVSDLYVLVIGNLVISVILLVMIILK